MAKTSTLKVTGARPSSIAMFEGTFAAVLGLGIAVLNSLANTIELTASTSSVLTGLTFGIVTGIVSILVVPFLYFSLGWLIGYVHGWVFNIIAEASGGIELKVDK